MYTKPLYKGKKVNQPKLFQCKVCGLFPPRNQDSFFDVASILG